MLCINQTAAFLRETICLNNDFKNATSQTDLLSAIRDSNFEISSIRNDSENATIESINQIDLSDVSFVENDSKNATIQQTFCSRQIILPVHSTASALSAALTIKRYIFSFFADTRRMRIIHF